MKLEKIVTEEYELSEEYCEAGFDKQVVANIFFVNNKFDRCTYRVSQAKYTYTDWLFLLKVAQKIKELQEEKGGLK